LLQVVEVASDRPSFLLDLFDPLDGHRVLAVAKVLAASITDELGELDDLVAVAQLDPHALSQLDGVQDGLGVGQKAHLVLGSVQQVPEAVFGVDCGNVVVHCELQAVVVGGAGDPGPFENLLQESKAR